MKQQLGQYVQEFYSDMIWIWYEITESELRWACSGDVEKFYDYHDPHRLI